jgi:hypothetical protein
MSKTFSITASHRFVNPDQLVVLPEGCRLAVRGFRILNFGHWNLFVFWFLVLGIFMIVIEHA